MTKTTVYAPASIGNVSLGFDVLGAALVPVSGDKLGDYVSVSEATSDSLDVQGPFAHKLPADASTNIVTQCLHFFREACALRGITIPSTAMSLEKNLPIGSGLGSSASSIVAAFAALNAHYGNHFNEDELLTMMGECEGQISGSVHYDNVAPSYLGGMTLMTGLSSPVTSKLPQVDSWYWTLCYSGISVSTSAARKILPEQVDMATALTFGRQLAVFVDALHQQDEARAASMMHDVIAEPYRQTLLPGFTEARAYCMSKGALAFGISGSGPTVFAVSDNKETADDLAQWLQQHYVQNKDGFSHVCRIPDEGVVIETTKM
ncbi:homoserine kinase [Alteromonas sediminis]|uniref:Homoserine kinase n=1 Tax=Alteromonas sediminis TaxID=2259342 RepID=A0A3N5YPT5_9ALTE|nr:homoserine kinase [Alteromonas sediminis]RPJ67901.1 homoserine kinase [Alteromonas sediminis]